MSTYLMLTVAVVLEVVGTVLLRSTESFTRPWPTAVCLLSYAAAIFLLSRVVEVIPVGVTYALWSGLGTVLVVGIAVTVLGDPLTWRIALGIVLVTSGVVLLNLTGAH